MGNKFNPQQPDSDIVNFFLCRNTSVTILFKPEKMMFFKIDEPFFVNSLVLESTHTPGKRGKIV